MTTGVEERAAMGTGSFPEDRSREGTLSAIRATMFRADRILSSYVPGLSSKIGKKGKIVKGMDGAGSVFRLPLVGRKIEPAPFPLAGRDHSISSARQNMV
jgi:hypothetical protein